MAFTFNCLNCGWDAGVCDARDIGRKAPEHVCSECGHMDKEWADYKFTSDEVVGGEIECRGGCGAYAHVRILKVGGGRSLNAQVGALEASKVAIHPVTGEAVFCYSKPGDVMPERYKQEGFEEKSFTSYLELQKFCRDRNLVNDVEGDYHHNDGYWEEVQAKRSKEEAAQYERYMDERAQVMAAYPELRKQGR